MNRPIGITILSFLLMVNGVIYILLGFMASFILLIIGVIVALAGIGLFEMKLWAWYFGLLSYGLSALFSLFGAVDGDFGSIISLAIAIAVIIYLLLVSGEFQEENSRPVYSESETKDDAFNALFRNANIKSEYFDEKSKYRCPKCGSKDIDLMHDGSGVCNKCKKSFLAAVKSEA